MKEITEEKKEVFESFKGKTPCYVSFEDEIIENIEKVKRVF